MICLSPIPHSELLLLPCTHNFHSDCLKEYFKSQIQIKSLPLRCVCKLPVDEELPRQILDADSLALMDKRFREKKVESDPLKKWCPHPDCGEHVQVDDQITKKTKLSCPKGHEFCGNCHEKWHENKSCKSAIGVSILLTVFIEL